MMVAALFALTGCEPAVTQSEMPTSSAPKKLKIAFVSSSPDPFWVLCERGVEAAGKEFGVDVAFQMPSEGITSQKRILEDLVSKGTDGIAVSPIDPANQTDVHNLVAERSTLVTADSDAPDSERLVYIGISNYEAGRMAAQLMKEALPNGGQVMIFVGRLEQDNAKLRRQGFIDELIGREPDPTRYDLPTAQPQGNGFTVLGTLTDQFDRAKAKANVEDTLSKNPDIDGMIGLFAYNPPAILEALKQSDRIGKVKVIGFDENETTLKGIIDHEVHGTIVQNPYEYGYQSVKVLAEYLSGNESVIPADKYMEIPARKIVADNVKEFWDQLKERLGER